MSSMLPLSTWQYGVSWPIITTVADQAVYLLWKCLFVCLFVGMHASNLLFTLCTNDPPRILVR